MSRHSIFLVIFTISGFSGLIYESIWSQYLKLFLGHAAYAQVLVLAIFMGGMALGSWLCSRFSMRWTNLLNLYAWTELLIGLAALFFHGIFVSTTGFAYDFVIPALSSSLSVDLFKWGLAALIILPQSILLGMTFPLITGAFLRIFPEQPGHSVALLYFVNSIGAVLGVLASGFIFIQMIGLPGTIQLAGTLNLLIAGAVWLLIRNEKEPLAAAEERVTPPSSTIYIIMLSAALLTGAASFIYEVAWIRMLNLVLGSSTHAFELMLSSFILGLALGGWWIKRKIDTIGDTIRTLAFIQIAMGFLALSTLIFYNGTFDVMEWLVAILPKDDLGYLVFNLSSYGIAIAVMLPATFCAGMTLPLITFKLLREGHGEKSIGGVYAANTVGAIIGVFFAIHIGFPVLGLKGLLAVGCGLDVALGLFLFSLCAGTWRNRSLVAAGTVALFAVILSTAQLDLLKMASGVYRAGNILDAGSELLYQQDGKTATVSVTRSRKALSIRTNGKVDAGVSPVPYGPPVADEGTMVLAGALPQGFNPRARRVANIGFGSGITTHTLLSSSRIEEVDTIEIEKKIVEAAKFFDQRNSLAYTDPRSEIIIDDAKTYFAKARKTYDIIVSEPSNPWVSGISSLFGEEFYHLIGRYLTDDGLFVQWVQLYEIDTELVSSVFKAMSPYFDDYAVYSTGVDMLIIARKSGQLPPIDFNAIVEGRQAALARIGILNPEDVAVRMVGRKRFLDPLFQSMAIRSNSDYYPVLDQLAPRALFLKHTAMDLPALAHTQTPLSLLLEGGGAVDPQRITASGFSSKSLVVADALSLRDYFTGARQSPVLRAAPKELVAQAGMFKAMLAGEVSFGEEERIALVDRLLRHMVSFLSPQSLFEFWATVETTPYVASASALEKQYLQLYRAIGARDARGMAVLAGSLLESDAHLPSERREYLVGVAMVGYLSQGEHLAAKALWGRWSPQLFGGGSPSLAFQFLIANSN